MRFFLGLSARTEREIVLSLRPNRVNQVFLVEQDVVAAHPTNRNRAGLESIRAHALELVYHLEGRYLEGSSLLESTALSV